MTLNNKSFVNGVATTAVLDEQNVYSSIYFKKLLDKTRKKQYNLN